MRHLSIAVNLKWGALYRPWCSQLESHGSCSAIHMVTRASRAAIEVSTRAYWSLQRAWDVASLGHENPAARPCGLDFFVHVHRHQSRRTSSNYLRTSAVKAAACDCSTASLFAKEGSGLRCYFLPEMVETFGANKKLKQKGRNPTDKLHKCFSCNS